jgi:type I restriction enzyme M protein
MAKYEELENKIEGIIDDLKGVCNQHGIGNTGDEERVITTVFLYKFLNDKFMYNLREFANKTYGLNGEQKAIDSECAAIFRNKNMELDAFYDAFSGNVIFNKEDTIEYLIQFASSNDFYKKFDAALKSISDNPRNIAFNIETADGTRRPLFEQVSGTVDESSRNNFCQAIFSSLSTAKFDFGVAFKEGESFDFYSRIFEYLIKDYNVASGKYAEYFTPQAVSEIIAKILVGMSGKVQACEVYDPSAGSGSLVLHLANELGKDKNISRAIVYTQDISQKSSRFLRINLLLNGLTDSLHNAIQGDTLVNPAHFAKEGDPQSGLKKFDYIVANPPFNLDFSSTRDTIEGKWINTEDETGLKRFFAGIPNVPNKKKTSMAIYLCFIQHILFSLKDSGKAAIVVPTSFLTAQTDIELSIRKKIIECNWLKGVISMPSNIFATTNTSVSVMFIDKTKKDSFSCLIDASKLGQKIKEGSIQRTFLSDAETSRIEDDFIQQKEETEFSVLVSSDQIKEKNYSFAPGQHFVVRPSLEKMDLQNFLTKTSSMKEQLNVLENENQKLHKEITESFDKIYPHGNN